MVRKMKISDATGVAELEKECFSEPWSERSLMEYAQKKDALFLVYEKEDCIAGYAGMYYVYPEAYITNVAVTKSCRGRGYAKEILKQMFELSKYSGIERCTLEVRKSNKAAISLYEGLGFKMAGERKNFYDNPTENPIIMWKDYQ